MMPRVTQPVTPNSHPGLPDTSAPALSTIWCILPKKPCKRAQELSLARSLHSQEAPIVQGTVVDGYLFSSTSRRVEMIVWESVLGTELHPAVDFEYTAWIRSLSREGQCDSQTSLEARSLTR